MAPGFIACALACIVGSAYARTDLTGCTSTDVSSPAGASYAWYVPGTGEICAFLDCGGGTDPPKTDVPGCPLYSGTSTYSPSYLPGYAATTAQAPTATAMITSNGVGTTSSVAVSSTWTSGDSNGSPLICALATSCPMTTSTSTYSISTSTQTIIQTYNQTSPTGLSGPNTSDTMANATASTSQNTISIAGSAVETAGAWAGSVGFIVGLGVLVAAM